MVALRARHSSPASTGPSCAGISLLGVVVLTGIVSLVVLVTLPLLQDFAARENQDDARRTLALLASLSSEEEVLAGERTPLETARERPRVLRQLADRRWLDDGRLVRHGYVFDCARGEAASGWYLRAWPARYGRTGFKAYVLEPGGRLIEHDAGTSSWRASDVPPSLRSAADDTASER